MIYNYYYNCYYNYNYNYNEYHYKYNYQSITISVTISIATRITIGRNITIIITSFRFLQKHFALRTFLCVRISKVE